MGTVLHLRTIRLQSQGTKGCLVPHYIILMVRRWRTVPISLSYTT
jgi:hypothetical protein